MNASRSCVIYSSTRLDAFCNEPLTAEDRSSNRVHVMRSSSKPKVSAYFHLFNYVDSNEKKYIPRGR